MHLVVGLGNPGREYEATRHNIGFMVLDELAKRWSLGAWKSKFGGELAQAGTGDAAVVALKPMEFMNLSGGPTQRAAAFYKIAPREIVIVHDEIDLDFGRLKVKVGGGHGGHNGLRSLIEHLGQDFTRVRCGVGKPAGGKEKVTGHVLGGFSKAEDKELPLLVGTAADAVEAILQKGPLAAMNQFNQEAPK